ncbi:phospho-N-acetylmuramoyl-pentapeptide-transferase [bacterium DOLZORAL124_38_8]|nr:MAG: phospho-N-acetylmuramoyl-pentapeptide-transferase [bacterium DOLZORAL124_38_8]
MKSLHIWNLVQIIFYSGLTFVLAVLVFPYFIDWLRRFKLTQKIREDGLSGGAAKLFQKLHLHKAGTPTMGGVVIVAAVLCTVLFSRIFSYFGWIDHSLLNRGQTYLPVITLFCVGVLGVVDDYLNITESSAQKGLSAKVKMITLILFSVIAAFWFVFKLEYSLIHIPGIGDFEIGLWYFPLFVFVITGTSNAVNFTDGLDGLAGGLLAISYGVFAVIAYFFGLPYLAIFCSVIVSALIAFLWFNVPPAKIYMGDTGSLALGATLGVIAMMTNALAILVIVGVVFILETVSVILQLFWKKYFKKKLFLIAPIHHHFEAKGWSETQIVMRFWIIGLVFGAIGLIIGLIGMGKGVI